MNVYIVQRRIYCATFRDVVVWMVEQNYCRCFLRFGAARTLDG